MCVYIYECFKKNSILKRKEFLVLTSANQEPMEIEVEILKTNICSWETEIWIMKQQEESIQKALAFLKNSLQATEDRQKKMVIFLTKSSADPNFIPRFIEQLLEEEEAVRSNGNISWSTSTMLPFLKPKLMQLKGFREIESPFLRKMYEMVDDPDTNAIISWSPSGTSFFIRDKSTFKGLLLQYFGHDTIKNFTNCLSAYGFKKVDSFLNEYQQEKFQRGQKHMLKHIKKRPSKLDTLKNLLEDMVAEVKRLRDHQNIEITNEISNLKQQEEKRKSCLSSVEECLKHAKCKLKQIKESSNLRTRKEARPWLDPFKNIDKVKNAMDKMEVDIINLESNQESTANYLIGLKGFFLTIESTQQQMEIYMGKTLRIFGFDEEVRKKPRAIKPRHDKLTRRRKPVGAPARSVQSTCSPYTVVTYQPETSTPLNANDLAWARELELDMKIESGRHELAIHHINEQSTKKHFETCPENSDELNMWARDLEDDLVSEADQTRESKTHVLRQNTNVKFDSFSTETFEHVNKSSATLINHDMIKKSGTSPASNYHVEEQIKNEGVVSSKSNCEDIDLWVSVIEGDVVFE